MFNLSSSFAHPNSVAHIGNDTFLVALSGKDVTSVHVCTSSFPPHSRVVRVPLSRKVCLNFESSTTPDRCPHKNNNSGHPHCNNGSCLEEGATSFTAASSSKDIGGEESSSAAGYHHLYPSPDGKIVAIIAHQHYSQNPSFAAGDEHSITGSVCSQRKLTHYLIVLTNVPFEVFEFQTPPGRNVQSVCWFMGRSYFPNEKINESETNEETMKNLSSTTSLLDTQTCPRRLLILLHSGELLSYDLSIAHLGVAFPPPKVVDILKYLFGKSCVPCLSSISSWSGKGVCSSKFFSSSALKESTGNTSPGQSGTEKDSANEADHGGVDKSVPLHLHMTTSSSTDKSGVPNHSSPLAAGASPFFKGSISNANTNKMGTNEKETEVSAPAAVGLHRKEPGVTSGVQKHVSPTAGSLLTSKGLNPFGVGQVDVSFQGSKAVTSLRKDKSVSLGLAAASDDVKYRTGANEKTTKNTEAAIPPLTLPMGNNNNDKNSFSSLPCRNGASSSPNNNNNKVNVSKKQPALNDNKCSPAGVSWGMGKHPSAEKGPLELEKSSAEKLFHKIFVRDAEAGDHGHGHADEDDEERSFLRHWLGDLFHLVVDIHVVPPTRSLPSILLLLTRYGDVYAAKVDEEYGLPLQGLSAMSSASDGLEETWIHQDTAAISLMHHWEGGQTKPHGSWPCIEHHCKKVSPKAFRTFVHRHPQGDQPPPPHSSSRSAWRCTGFHHLIKGSLEGGRNKDTSEGCSDLGMALSVRSVLLDEDTGLHVILIAYDNGRVTGTPVEEPHLLARDRVVTSQTKNAVDWKEKDYPNGSPAMTCVWKTPPHRSTLEFVPLEPHWNIHLGRVPSSSCSSPTADNHFSEEGRKASVRDIGPAGAGTLCPPRVQMNVIHHVCFIRYDECHAYLVALPSWNVSRGGWTYWNPFLTKKKCAAHEGVNTKRREVNNVSAAPDRSSAAPLALPSSSSLLADCREEEWKWSLIQTNSLPLPEPIALRIPFDLRGICVGVGRGELLLAPSKIDTIVLAPNQESLPKYSNHAHPPSTLLSVEIPNLLRGSIYATANSWGWSWPSFSSSPECANGKRSKEGERGSNEDEKEIAGSSSEDEMLMRINSKKTEGVRGQKEDVDRLLKETLHGLSMAYRSIFSGETEEMVRAKKLEVMKYLEKSVNTQEEAENELTEREKQLQERVQLLQRDVFFARNFLEKSEKDLLEAIVHQRGQISFHIANKRLGIVHAALSKIEEQLSSISIQ